MSQQESAACPTVSSHVQFVVSKPFPMLFDSQGTNIEQYSVTPRFQDLPESQRARAICKSRYMLVTWVLTRGEHENYCWITTEQGLSAEHMAMGSILNVHCLGAWKEV